MRSTPSLPSLAGPLWLGVVAPDRALSMGQIELICILMLNWILWNRTAYMYKNRFVINNLQWLMRHKTKPNQTKPSLTLTLSTYIHTYVCMYVCICTYVYICGYIYVCICGYIYIYINYLYIYMGVWINIYISIISLCLSLSFYIYIYIYIYHS